MGPSEWAMNLAKMLRQQHGGAELSDTDLGYALDAARRHGEVEGLQHARALVDAKLRELT